MAKKVGDEAYSGSVGKQGEMEGVVIAEIRRKYRAAATAEERKGGKPPKASDKK